jgi:hypothetical protein
LTGEHFVSAHGEPPRRVDLVTGRFITAVRAAAIVFAVASAGLVACWQLTAHSVSTPSGLMAIAAVMLAGAVVALLARSGWLRDPASTGPAIRRGVALRRKSWGAVYQRQLNPDAAGHARPRAPSVAPAAA